MHTIIRRGGELTINGKLVFDFRKETHHTVAGATELLAKRLSDILQNVDYVNRETEKDD